MIEVLKWLVSAGGILFVSFGFGLLLNSVGFDENQVFSLILGSILVTGSIVAYYLSEIQMELTTMRKQGEKL